MTDKTTRIYAPIFIAVSIIFVLLILKPAYHKYMDSMVQLQSLESIKASKQKELDERIAIKNIIDTSTGSINLVDRINKLTKVWNEADILSSIMLNEYTQSTAFSPAPISVGSIAIDSGKKLPNGIKLGTVQFSLSGKSIDDIIGYLTYLTNNAPYIYILDTISLPISTPIQESIDGMSFPITLGIYYYE